MRKKFFITFLTIVSAFCLAFGITACGSESSSTGGGSSSGSTTKQTPVYQGMVISSADTASSASAKLMSAQLTADQYGDESGDWYGDDYYYYHNHYRGDYEGKDSDIDYDQPYGDDTPTIEQEVETTLQVTGTGQSIYYADKDENIYITIKLSNPDSFEILSFVLNGTKYTSYMFEDGSDLENIVVKLNVGSVGGILEYTIDEIKYVDGTEIKDVLLNGDTVVKCGVRADDQTYAAVSEETHDLNNISFRVKIVDLYSLIEYSSGYAMAVLFDGDSLIQTVNLSVGTNAVQFTDLTPNTLYQYAIVALYDDLSGGGISLNYLYKNAVYTDTIVLFDNITVEQESITFGYSWYDGYSAATITQLTLTTGGKTQSLDSSATGVIGLLSNNEYVLTASYINTDGETESISLTFTTLEKATPVVEITSLTSTQTAIDYALSITDTDSVGSLTSVTLSLNGITVETLTTSTGTFSGLLSNNTYTLTVVYTYNLNDGEGERKIEVSQTITTQAKETPVVVIDSLTSTQTEVNYALRITDTDSVGSITSVTLSLNGNTVETLTNSTGTFSGLLSNNTYTLTAVYTYNLNDGEGERKLEVTDTITTQAKATPVVVIDSLTSTQTAIDYALGITDTDSVGSITSVTLSVNEKTVETLTTSTGTFSGLLSNNTYTLSAIYTYNLNDGTGDHKLEVTETITTQAKATPVVVIDTLTSTQTEINYALGITDTDSVGSLTSVTLSLNGNTVETLTTSTGIFSGLLSNNTYTLTVVYTYDLNDGTGEQKTTVTKDITTVAKTAPELSVLNDSITDTTISGVLNIVDIDNVGYINSVSVYKDETLISTNTENEVEFSGLEYYTEYTVIINYSYDLNDGMGIQTKVYTKDYKTDPHIEFNSCKIINTSAVSEGETIYMQVVLDNPSGALPSSVVVNGETYQCSSSTSSSKIYVEIVYNGQFEGGTTILTIELVNMTLDGVIYSLIPTENNSGSVFINGALSVESLQVVNESVETIEYAFPDETVSLLLTLKNKTGYSIDSITINNNATTNYSKIDDNHYLINVTLSYGWNVYTITSISYSNGDLAKTLGIGGITSNRVYKVNSSTVIEIDSAETFMNTTYNGGYYKLVADIDLFGIEWTNLGTFYGVLDGNGYSILNLTNASTVTDSDVYIGLFKEGRGIFYNVKIENITVMITLISTNEDQYDCYFGSFIVDDGGVYTIFKDCEVVGDISINNTTGGETCAGGYIGHSWPYPDYLYMENCKANVDISLKNGTNKTGCAAGIVGEYSWANLEIYIYNCDIKGSVSASSVAVLNCATPWSTCIVDYKNNTCDIYLNGVRYTEISDYYSYIN